MGSQAKWKTTDQEIAGWGHMALTTRMLDHLGPEQALANAQRPAAGSNRGSVPGQPIVQFMLAA